MINFNNGLKDRKGRDLGVCCDAAREGFTGSKFEQYQEVNNEAYFNRLKLNAEGTTIGRFRSGPKATN